MGTQFPRGLRTQNAHSVRSIPMLSTFEVQRRKAYGRPGPGESLDSTDASGCLAVRFSVEWSRRSSTTDSNAPIRSTWETSRPGNERSQLALVNETKKSARVSWRVKRKFAGK